MCCAVLDIHPVKFTANTSSSDFIEGNVYLHIYDYFHKSCILYLVPVCLSIFLWTRNIARFRRVTFVSRWYLPRIWPYGTDMQYYYHARYPTDDWHLAYMLSLVYFSVDVCLVGVFPNSVSTRRDPCARVCTPLTLASPLTRKQKSKRGDPALHLGQVRGHLSWRMGLPALFGGNLGCWIF